jgi:hypothetical protein
VEEQDLLNLTRHRNLQKGGVCIFVREDQRFNKIDTPLHCAEKTLEVHAIESETKSSNLRTLALYRTPSANFNHFLRLDATLRCLYNPKSVFIICGDRDADYLNDNNLKTNSLLTTYKLSHTLHFATRTQNYTSTTINNILDTRLSSSSTFPIINGLSDCHA